jgi:hypothetical protein
MVWVVRDVALVLVRSGLARTKRWDMEYAVPIHITRHETGLGWLFSFGNWEFIGMGKDKGSD